VAGGDAISAIVERHVVVLIDAGVADDAPSCVAKSLAIDAAELNARGLPAARGGQWHLPPDGPARGRSGGMSKRHEYQGPRQAWTPVYWLGRVLGYTVTLFGESPSAGVVAHRHGAGSVLLF
jgi:hypothetical protein